VSNIGLWREKRTPDLSVDYYRVNARFISAHDLSRVFARFVSFAPIESGQLQKLSRSKRSLLQVFEEFLHRKGITFKVRKC
jgi:hypothetical protein